MQLTTLAEAKDFLSIDFDTKDREIEIRVNAIESYLFNGTGLKFETIPNDDSDEIYNLAKQYVLTRLYFDYYPNENNEIIQRNLTAQIKQLQALARTQ